MRVGGGGVQKTLRWLQQVLFYVGRGPAAAGEARSAQRPLALKYLLGRITTIRLSNSFWLIFLPIVLAALMLRGTLLYAPMFGFDDLIYYLDGRYFPHQAALGQYEIKLGYKPNVLYFALVKVWHELAGADAYMVGRLFQDVTFLAGALIIFVLSRHAFGGPAARKTTLFYLLLPLSIYTVSLVPDTPVETMFYLLALVFSTGWPSRPLATAISLGILVAVAYLIKPPALACIPSILAAMSVSPLLPFAPPIGWRRAGLSMIIFVLACGAAFALLHVLAPQPWSILLPFLLALAVLVWSLLNLPLPRWRPSISSLRSRQLRLAGAGLVVLMLLSILAAYAWLRPAGEFIGVSYANDAAALLSLSFWLHHLLGTARYFGANLIALAAIFPYAFVLTGNYLWRARHAGHEVTAYSGPGLSLLAFLVAAVLFLVLMTSIATEVHSEDPFEGNRFSGRYYIFLIPLLIAVLFGLGRDASPRAAKACAGLGLAALGILAYLINSIFRVYPWDFPELFAFFSAPNHYQWDFAKPWPALLNYGGYISLIGGGLTALVVLARPGLLVSAYGAFMTLIVLVGQIQVNAYMFAWSDIVRWRADDARAIAQLLVPVQAGDGVVVADQRYASVSEFVFSLRAPQWLLVRPSGAHLTETDLPPDVSWVAAINDYVADFHYRYSLKFEHTSLYVLSQNTPLLHESEKLVWQGTEPMRLNFVGGKDAKALTGFNSPEGWGIWSATDVATIALPQLVVGDITLKINVAALPENVQEPLRIQIGDAHAELSLKTDSLTYELRLAPTWPTDTIRLEMATVRPVPRDSRSLGVGLTWIEISRP